MEPTWEDLIGPLNAALLSAFNRGRFRVMLRTKCNRNFDHLVTSGSAFPEEVVEVIEHAASDGWLECLARGARDTVTGNVALQEVTVAILAGIEAEGISFYQSSVTVQQENDVPDAEKASVTIGAG